MNPARNGAAPAAPDRAVVHEWEVEEEPPFRCAEWRERCERNAHAPGAKCEMHYDQDREREE